MSPTLRRLVRDDGAQDIVEYALLAAGFGLVGLAAWPAIRTALGNVYPTLQQNNYNLWEPPAPGGGS